MCKVISVTSSKGGTGKTTTCTNVGIGLANEGYKVLLIDNDSQGSLTVHMGQENPDSLEETLASYMEHIIDDKEYDSSSMIISHTEGVDYIPANRKLADVERQLQQEYGGEHILEECLKKLRSRYDYILIDCQPTLNYLTLNALCASDALIIPVQPAYLSLKGLEMMLDQVAKTRRWLNPRLKIDGILITQINERTIYAREIVNAIQETYGDKINVFKSRIPYSVRIQESSLDGSSIYQTDPNGKAAKAYRNLTQEVLVV